MKRLSYCPIRTTVGSQVGIVDVRMIRCSNALNVLPCASLQAEPTHPARQGIYQKFWPELQSVGGLVAQAGPGIADCPLPDDAPFSAQQPALMLYGLDAKPPTRDPAEYWVEYELTLDARKSGLIGGIAVSGCRFLPYLSSPAGDNLSNFGLPREIQVSWDDASAQGFLDAEQQFTLQRANWHSGFHYLAFGPVRTTRLRLRLSGFPQLLCRQMQPADPSAGFVPTLPGAVGFLIPFLYVFEHRESVVYQSHVPCGLLAAWQSRSTQQHSYARHLMPRADAAALAADPADRVEFALAPSGILPAGRYRVYSAASALGTPRQFADASQAIAEFFCSDRLERGDVVRFVIAQSRQHEACIAGLRLRTPTESDLPDASLGKGSFELKVYESDLPAGAEPISRVPSDRVDAYRVHLATRRFSLRDAVKGIDLRFVRASNARVFLLEFTAHGASAQILAMREIRLVQSAQVSLSPNGAHRRQVRALGFRMIAADLASAYDTLGPGAVFEVSRHAGAGRNEVLFRADSLLDLIEKTGAKLYRNGRSWDTVAETSRLEARTHGWQRRESGKEVRWTHQDSDTQRVPSAPPRPAWAQAATPRSFRVLGNQETRTHSEQLGYQNDRGTRSILRTVNRMVASASGDDDEKFVDLVAVNADRLVAGFRSAWHGLAEPKRVKIKTIRGIYNLNVPPHALALNYLSTLDHLLSSDGDPTAVTNAFFKNAASGALLSGASVSLGASVSAFVVGANASYSVGQQLPAASRIVQMGEGGTIQIQASDSNYQYSQTLNHGFDDSTQLRQVLDRRRDVLSSPDVKWQGEYVDIVSGRIPMPMTLEALGGRMHGDPELAIVVRCAGLNAQDLRTDIWFDLSEEEVRDDH